MTKSDAIIFLKSMLRVHKHMIEVDADNGGMVGREFLENRIEALKMAIQSLEIDAKYDLEYEKTKEEAES